MSTSNHRNNNISSPTGRPRRGEDRVGDSNAPIGFFDSGVGGLSVYARFKKLLPNENTLYFGDLANMPYGNKTKEQLICYARNILDFYKEKEVKAVVIACNTSSAQAYDVIKDEYDFKIYPIIQSCAKVIASQGFNRLGVFATEATVKSGVYTRELQKYNQSLQVLEIPCPNWVPIVENGNYVNGEDDVRIQLDKMQGFAPDKIVLGCTHYPYLKRLLSKFAPEDLFIDPAEIFVKFIKEDMPLNDSSVQGSEEIFVSANPENFMEHSKIFYDLKVLPTLVNSKIIPEKILQH